MKDFDCISAPCVVLKYYEELRSYALGYDIALVMPLGIDLFMKRGAMAWMIALSDYTKEKTIGIKTSQEASVPPGIQSEITMLLANMILSCGGAL